jgi:excisionase family DNA binding protein
MATYDMSLYATLSANTQGLSAMSDTPEKLHTFSEVQARLRTSERTLRRWIGAGLIEVTYAGRQLRFEEREVKRFLDAKRRARKKSA